MSNAGRLTPAAPSAALALRSAWRVFFSAVVALFIFSNAGIAGAREVHITSSEQSIELISTATVLVDKAGALSPDEVLNATQNDAVTRREKRPHLTPFGFNSTQAYWIRFDLIADTNSEWLLEIARHDLRHVQLFSLGHGGWQQGQAMGTEIPFSSRQLPHRNYLYRLTLEPGKNVVLARVQNDMVGEIRATLWRPAEFSDKETQFRNAAWLYFGLVGGMLIYNVLLYIIARDKTFLFYVLTTIGTLAVYLANTGLGSQHLWGDMPWWNGRMLSLASAWTQFFWIILTRRFFSTRECFVELDTALKLCSWLAICVFTLPFILKLTGVVSPRVIGGTLMLILTVVTAAVTVCVLVAAAHRRWPSAPYYYAAWIAGCLGPLIAGARYSGLLPTNVVTLNSLAICTGLFHLLLAIALAHQISVSKKSKEEAQLQALSIMRASQALSSETRLDQLLARVKQILGALTGATSLHLILRGSDRKFCLYSEVEADRLPLDDAKCESLFPVSAVLRVASTGNPLFINEKESDERDANQPALDASRKCALMILPVMHKGLVSAVVVLENGISLKIQEAVAETVQSIVASLAVTLENVLLYESLERRVSEKTAELQRAQQQLVENARRKGMAQVATNVLHNVGNVLNGVNVTSDLIRKRAEASKATGLEHLVNMLREHADHLGNFIENDPKGKLVLVYLAQLDEQLRNERKELVTLAADLTSRIEHIKNVVATQQMCAGPSIFLEALEPERLVEDAVRLTKDLLLQSRVNIHQDFERLSPMLLDHTRVVQVLVNLLVNAIAAMQHLKEVDRKLYLRIKTQDGLLRIFVQDLGCGLAAENLNRVFSPGYTTRKGGHGFGLHSCAIAAREMGGALKVVSDGPDTGATFVLEVPAVFA